jgi:PAS domain S-box-containing protein
MMRTAIDSRKFHAGLLLAGLLTPILLWPGVGSRTFSAAGFLPQSYCFVYQPAVTWLNAGSDVVIGLSFLAISATLAWRVHKARTSIPFSAAFLAFGVFIVASGLTHLMEVWTLWQPRYWLAGELKLITALASVATAIVLPPLVTRVIGLVQEGRLSRGRKLQLESANEESEKRWRAVYENSAVGIVLTDLSGRVLAANRAFQNIVGFTEEELQGGPLLELISADDRESSRTHIAELLGGTRREYYLEKRYKRKDGTFVWTLSSVSLIPGIQTTRPMLLRIVEDISARKAAQAQLLAIKDELAAELDAMTRLHELSTRLLATKALQPLLEEILEATIALQGADFGNVQLYNTQRRGWKIVAQRGFAQEFSDDFGFVEDNASACGRALQNQERVVIDDVQADAGFAMHRRIAAGSGFHAVQSTPLFSHDGEPLGMISMDFREPHRPTERELRMTDLYARLAAEMIERKQAEDERQKLASLVENSRDFIGIATLEGQAQFVNRAGRELLGLQSDDEIRTSILDYVAEEDRAKVEQDILPAVMRDGRWDGEVRFRHFKTGAAVPMLQDIFFIKEAGSEQPLALATISRDITERKRAEAALHTAQRSSRTSRA